MYLGWFDSGWNDGALSDVEPQLQSSYRRPDPVPTRIRLAESSLPRVLEQSGVRRRHSPFRE